MCMNYSITIVPLLFLKKNLLVEFKISAIIEGLSHRPKHYKHGTGRPFLLPSLTFFSLAKLLDYIPRASPQGLFA